MSMPITGNALIDQLLADVLSKGFSLDVSKNMWTLRDAEHNEFGFDPTYRPAMPLLARLLGDAVRYGTLCHAVEAA